MDVAEILKEKGTRIITVRLRETVDVAARLLRSENIGALVVKDVCRTEGNVVVGMFSERDVLRALVDHGPGVMQMAVEDLMSKTLVSCAPEDDLFAVARLMDEHRIRHLPVMENHTLIGVISVRDVVHATLTQRAAEAAPAG